MIIQFLCSFFFFSFIGWVYESTICSFVNEHCFINRGFLIGPYIPIYGVGAVLCYVFLKDITNPFFVFLEAMVLCSILEYATGYVMEKLFHARWWDYSDLPFNLHGRICLYGALIFGISNVFICFIIEPAFLNFLSRFSEETLWIISMIMIVVFASDLVMTLIAWADLNVRLQQLHQKLSDMTNMAMENLSDKMLEKIPLQITIDPQGVKFKIDEWNMKIKKNELRLIHAFPNIRILKYDQMIQKLNLKNRIKKVFTH